MCFILLIKSILWKFCAIKHLNDHSIFGILKNIIVNLFSIIQDFIIVSIFSSLCSKIWKRSKKVPKGISRTKSTFILTEVIYKKICCIGTHLKISFIYPTISVSKCERTYSHSISVYLTKISISYLIILLNCNNQMNSFFILEWIGLCKIILFISWMYYYLVWEDFYSSKYFTWRIVANCNYWLRIIWCIFCFKCELNSLWCSKSRHWSKSIDNTLCSSRKTKTFSTSIIYCPTISSICPCHIFSCGYYSLTSNFINYI